MVDGKILHDALCEVHISMHCTVEPNRLMIIVRDVVCLRCVAKMVYFV